MEFKGSELIRAKREELFGFITDPQHFARGIPDIQDIKVMGPDRFKVVAKLGISVIKTNFDIIFEASERTPPSHVKLHGHGLGGGSAVDLEIAIDLKEAGKDTTLEWAAVATVSGKLASLGQRVLFAVADKLVKEVFGNVRASLESLGPESQAKG
jgi:carbon monoxide dehydrogenase subunit G